MTYEFLDEIESIVQDIMWIENDCPVRLDRYIYNDHDTLRIKNECKDWLYKRVLYYLKTGISIRELKRKIVNIASKKINEISETKSYSIALRELQKIIDRHNQGI